MAESLPAADEALVYKANPIDRSTLMPLTTNDALDALARLMQMIGREPALLNCFREWTTCSSTDRRLRILAMAQSMEIDGEDEDLVTCVHLLADPRIFAAAQAALQDCGYLHE